MSQTAWNWLLLTFLLQVRANQELERDSGFAVLLGACLTLLSLAALVAFVVEIT